MKKTDYFQVNPRNLFHPLLFHYKNATTLFIAKKFENTPTRIKIGAIRIKIYQSRLGVDFDRIIIIVVRISNDFIRIQNSITRLDENLCGLMFTPPD